jgi:hypothetical protein
MPWWAALYTGLVALICVLGAVTDARDGSRTAWHIGLDLATGAALLFLMLGRWDTELIASMGRSAAALFAAMLLWDVYSTHLDIADLKDDPELTPRENAVVNWTGIVLGGIVVAPAYAFALASVVWAWRGVG